MLHIQLTPQQRCVLIANGQSLRSRAFVSNWTQILQLILCCVIEKYLRMSHDLFRGHTESHFFSWHSAAHWRSVFIAIHGIAKSSGC